MRSKVYASLLIWLAILLSAILPLVFFLLRLSGHVLSINSIRPISLRYVRYARQKLYTISTSSIHIKLHLPRPREPHWAKILVQNYQYRDPECSVSISTIKITLWFFPMLFRFTAGPLITLQFEDFRLHVYNSTYTPKWVRKLGDNLIYTAINEETVRLHQFKPRFVLNGLTVVTGCKERFDGPIEKPGMRPGQELDKFKINGRAQQWHIHNERNNRMYTYNSLETELRRSSAEDRQTLVIIARESKWTKLPLVGHFHDVSLLQYVKQTLISMPRELINILNDPLSIIDIDVRSCDITFAKFHLRDSAIMEQSGVLIKRKYEHSRDRGILSNTTIDSFVQAIISVYDKVG